MPSLYEATATVGDVASSNFTTLYNASNLTVPNAGAGSVSGNLNVAGNLTVQGTSLLVGAVTLGSTLSLPNYTFPSADGSTDQVLTTDGSGNLYFTSVSALGASYTIQADTISGGADLTLVSSGGVHDSVKFASGTNITVSRTDANTITIDSTATMIPNGTAQGQLLYWNGSAWIATDSIEFTATANRPSFINNVSGGFTAANFLKKYTGTLADGTSSAISLGATDGSTNTISNRVRSAYSTTANPVFRVEADPVGNFSPSSTTVYSQLTLDNNKLGINANQLIFLENHTGAPTQNATITVERGSSTDATFIWDEGVDRWSASNGLAAMGNLYVQGNISQDGDTLTINADNSAVDSTLMFNSTKSLMWNNAQTQFVLNGQLYITNNDLYVGSDHIRVNADNGSSVDSFLEFGDSLHYLKWDSLGLHFDVSHTFKTYGDLQADGDLYLNTNKTLADTYMYVQRNGVLATVSLRYHEANQRWQFTNDGTTFYDIPISIDDLSDVVITAPTAAGQFLYNDGSNWVNSSLINWNSNVYRTTFQGSNNTPGRAFTSFAAVNNTGATAYGEGDGSGMLIGIDSDSQAVKYIGSITAANYSSGNQVRLTTSTNSFAANTATSITGTNTLVFSAAHGFTAGTPIQYLTQTANGLTQDAIYYVLATGLTTTQCEISTTAGGSAVVLTNGTGLSLQFYNLNNTKRLIVADTNNLNINGTTLKLNANNTGVAASDAYFSVERGSTGADVSIKWDSATSRWQDTTDGSTFLNLPNQNLDITSDVNFSSVIIDNISAIDTGSATTTSTSTIAIATTTRNVMKAVVYLKDNVTTDVHTVEALLLRNGAVSMVTTYGEMYSTAALATFSTDVSGSSMRLLVTPASANSTAISVVRTSLT